MKIVINNCFGGFGLSHKAVMRYAELVGMKLYSYVSGSQLRDFIPYTGSEKHYMGIYYLTAPIDENGKYDEDSWFSYRDIGRTDENLIKVIEELGEDADGDSAQLKIVEIPDDVEWEIDEYDGNETIDEVHRSWS